MSASSISKAQLLLAERLAAAPAPQRAAKAKTVKGQRNAATRAVKATEIESIYQECWQAPAPFSTWSFYQSGTTYKTVERALDAGRGDLVVAYQRYVNHTFETPFNAPAFEKIAKREAYLERQGKQDLGLLGYSAIDRVQLASWYAFVRQIQDWLTQTGASEETVKVIGRALRDFRSDAELREDARLGEAARYEYGTDGRLRRKSQTKHVLDARQFLAARRLFNLYPVSEYAQSWVPSVGAVYREVHAVTREGLRQFRNTLEGLTPEGFITDASQYSASVRVGEAGSVKVGDLVDAMATSSVEDELFEYTVISEQELQRTATLNALRAEVTSMLPAEIEAFTFLELLNEGMSLIELREVFGTKTERAFAALLRDAQYLVSTK